MIIYDLIKYAYQQAEKECESLEFYHFAYDVYCHDDEFREMTYIKNGKNMLMGIWFWDSNTLYVFTHGTNTRLKRESQLICYPLVNRYVFDRYFNLIYHNEEKIVDD